MTATSSKHLKGFNLKMLEWLEAKFKGVIDPELVMGQPDQAMSKGSTTNPERVYSHRYFSPVIQMREQSKRVALATPARLFFMSPTPSHRLH